MTLPSIRPSELFSDIAAYADTGVLSAALGYDPAQLPEHLAEKISTLSALTISRVRIGMVLVQTPVVSWDNLAIYARGMEVISSKWADTVDRMDGQRTLHCFVLTLGRELDDLLEQTGKNALFEAYALDRLGSLLVEKAADALEKRLRKALRADGCGLSRRFSPGYCDWDLAAGQKTLFDFAHPENTGIYLLSRGAMQPSKTISGVMVSAAKVPLRMPCPYCEDLSCRHRRS